MAKLSKHSGPLYGKHNCCHVLLNNDAEGNDKTRSVFPDLVGLDFLKTHSDEKCCFSVFNMHFSHTGRHIKKKLSLKMSF